MSKTPVPTELERARNLAWWLRDALDKPFVGAREAALAELLNRAQSNTRVDDSLGPQELNEFTRVETALAQLRDALEVVLRDCQAPVATVGEVRGG